jgi:hypothetical protein
MKTVLADVIFIISLTLVINVDRLASFIEGILNNEPGDNALSDFLDSHSFLRNAWNILIAELWAMLIQIFWKLGIWTETSQVSAKSFHS